jgi:hypothetical protein
MAGYLEHYGVSDARRSRVIRWIVTSAAVAGISALVLYFTLRTLPAKQHVGVFLDDLKRHDYKRAYGDWGCAKECSDYPFASFMRDWGPQSDFADAADAQIRKSRFCNAGVIVTLAPPKGENVALWYQRSNETLGFAPWPVCAEHIPAPVSAPAP